MFNLSFQVFLLVFGSTVFLFSKNERLFLRNAVAHGVVYARRFSKAHKLAGRFLVLASVFWFLVSTLG